MSPPERPDGPPLDADGGLTARARYSSPSEPAPAHPAEALRSVLVEYPDRPDRRTVCPRGLGREAVMVTWLTADAGAFVDLLAAR